MHVRRVRHWPAALARPFPTLRLTELSPYSACLLCKRCCAAALRGGGIGTTSSLTSGGLTIRNVAFRRNIAGTEGGALWLQSKGKGNVTDCIFEDNAAVDGGAIFAFENQDINVVGCAFSNNTAARAGGSILQVGILHSCSLPLGCCSVTRFVLYFDHVCV